MTGERPRGAEAALDRRVAHELALFLAAGLFLYVLSVSFGLYGRIIGWANAPHSPAVDAWVTLVLVLGVAFATFAVRRWVDLSQEVVRRTEAEAGIEAERARLAEVVATQDALVRAELELEPTLALVVERAAALVSADGAAVEVFDGEALVVRAATGLLENEVGDRRAVGSTLSGRAFRDATVVAYTDVVAANDAPSEALPGGVRAIVAAPLRDHGETLGVLTVVSHRPGALTEADEQTLQLVAGFIAAAISHAMAFQSQEALLHELTTAVNRVRRTNAFFRLLQNVAVAANEARDAEEVLGRAVKEVCAYTGWPVGHAYLVREGEHGPVLEPTDQWTLAHPRRHAALRRLTMERSLAAGEDLPGRALADGKPAWITSLDEDPGFTRGHEAGPLGVRSAFALPIVVGRRCVAVLEFFHEHEESRDGSLLGLLDHVATQVARVFERGQARDALSAYADELERSNQELQEFAYVASHDLQEPLRMVRSYLQLLDRRYGQALDEDAHEFLDFAVDGATRMQGLIRDLLLYSRVGTQGKEFVPTRLEDALGAAVLNLEVAIAESGAKITWDELPELPADAGQLAQLFQNLVANAIKFRGEEPPRIHVGAEREGSEWTLTVQDNGIGLPPDAAERVFVIFQRLHTRERYEGTGIGLAVCKRIVERHGGRIWVESDGEGQGARFRFTLPVKGPRPKSAIDDLFLVRAVDEA